MCVCVICKWKPHPYKLTSHHTHQAPPTCIPVFSRTSTTMSQLKNVMRLNIMMVGTKKADIRSAMSWMGAWGGGIPTPYEQLIESPTPLRDHMPHSLKGSHAPPSQGITCPIPSRDHMPRPLKGSHAHPLKGSHAPPSQGITCPIPSRGHMPHPLKRSHATPPQGITCPALSRNHMPTLTRITCPH